MYALREFIERMFVDGTIRLTDVAEATEGEIQAAVDWVIEVELQLREHWPSVPPEIDRASLAWAIRNFHSAAQLAVYRQLGPEEISLRLDGNCFVEGATTVYSIDLIFRFLPDLVRIVKGMNPDDPLHHWLRRWGAQLPLSSVGIPELNVSQVEPVLADRCLAILYVDRIFEAEAADRLTDTRVRELVRAAIGAYPELSPKLHAALAAEPQTTDGAHSHD